jgi:DNA-binding NarL/FixJ family response regulator
MSTIRTLFVEDFKPFRTFVSSMLGQDPRFEVVCEVSDGLEGVVKAQELRPDLILVDIGLPKLNGLEAARRIRELVPASKIVFLTEEGDSDVVQEALRLGASGFVAKRQTATKLLPAVTAALEPTAAF